MSAETHDKARAFLGAFKLAIEAERQAQAMYSGLKEMSDTELLRQLFDGFYRDEVRHERELVSRYNELRQKSGIED
jgi:rubrerythrin